MSLPAPGPRPLAAVTSEHIASPTKTAIPLGSLPGRDEPDRSESPGGTADLHAAAGDRCGGESSPWESVPFGRRRPPDHTLPDLRAKAPVEPSLNRDPPGPSARTGQARPVRGPGGTADLHAAAGVRWPPGSGPDGTSPTGHAARASSGERPRFPRPSARTGQARPVRGPGWTADLHAAAGSRRLPVTVSGRDRPVRTP